MLRCTRARRLEVEKYENFLVNHVALLKVEATRQIGQSQGQLVTSGPVSLLPFRMFHHCHCIQWSALPVFVSMFRVVSRNVASTRLKQRTLESPQLCVSPLQNKAKLIRYCPHSTAFNTEPPCRELRLAPHSVL